MTPSPVNPAPDWVGLAGAAATAVINFALIASGPSTAFIAGACLFWAAFIFVRVRSDSSILRVWGFRTDNLGRASLIPGGICVLGVAACGVFASVNGTLRFPGHALFLLLIYPVWGVIQQFLVLGVVVGNLVRIRGMRERTLLIVLIGATAFGFVHAYDLRLVPATFLLELLIIPLYFRDRNLWPLGVLHGWLGLFFYLWVLNRDLWLEYLG